MARRPKKPAPPPPAAPRDGGGITRRDLLKGGGALLGGVLLAAHGEALLRCARRAEAGEIMGEGRYALADPENVLYTSCLNCLNGCPVKVKVLDGIAVKMDGSPYSPFSLSPHLPMSVSPFETALLDAPICPKGQSGIQSAYDPYRIVKVLKRAGKRGEGKWATIPFDRAVDEIVKGGKLFAHVPGEEDRVVEGLASIRSLTDPAVMKAMADDAAAIRKAGTREERARLVEAFRVRHAPHLGTLIDADHPDLGPRNNQFVYFWGRMRPGRVEFTTRFFNDAYGTVNTHTHTSACVGAMQYAGRAMAEQYDGEGFSGGPKGYWGVDYDHAGYVLCAGVNMFDANFGPPHRAARVARRIADGSLKVAVADPRFSKAASKAHRYLPVEPGTDGALFLAIARWMIDRGKYDEAYLSCANRAAAKAAGEPTWTNAALLVKIGPDGVPGPFLRASEAGLREPELRRGKDGKDRSYGFLVAMGDDGPVAVDPNDEKTAVRGKLLVDGTVKGFRVKSGFQLVADEARSRTMEEWSALCGIPAAEIEAVAAELAAHGKRAAVDISRGVSMHTNGFHNVLAAMAVNLLLGNLDHRGGVIYPAAWAHPGGKPGQPFDLPKSVPGKLGCFGITAIRSDVRYEDTTLFDGYPARRNWYPLANDLYHEVVPSIGDGYPYPARALMTFMGAPTYTVPAGQAQGEILRDTAKVPLYFASDILVGPTSMYADYVFPDLSFLERWEMSATQWGLAPKVQPIRQPVIAPVTERVTVFGNEVPCSYEALLLALAERMRLPGFGPDGFGPGQEFTRPDDLYVRMAANVATEGEPVPDADDREVDLFLRSRRHLPRAVFDPYRWERIAGPAWRKVVYVLNRGGRFQEAEAVWQGEVASNRYGRLANWYQEKTASVRHSHDGTPVPGYAVFRPVRLLDGRTPAQAGLVEGYPLHLLTQRDITQTKSRTITNYWLTNAVRPENEILVHPRDAKAAGLSPGDRARIVSATNREGRWDLGNGLVRAVEGRVKVTETIRPGAVTFTIGHGHWASGASDIVIDGLRVAGDPRRAGGFNANAVMWTDPFLKNTPVCDPVGGSISFYDTRVRLERA